MVDAAEELTNISERQTFYQEAAYDVARRVKLVQERKVTETPVGILEFIRSPRYMKMGTATRPMPHSKVIGDLVAMNNGVRIESVLTGSIGASKTTLALLTMAYQLYLLGIMVNPHDEFGIAPSDEIVFLMQSVNSSLAKTVDYKRLQNMINASPWFMSKFKYDKYILSEMRFPRNIIIKPVPGYSTAALGQNVFGGVIDEINFMAVIEHSKMNIDGGTFDQAQENYQAIARRRESRFMKQGWLPGMLCLVSSRRYPGQFTDRKEIEAKKNPRIYVYDRKIWEVKPDDEFTGEWFDVFVGDGSRRPRLMVEDEEVSEKDRRLVLTVPMEFKNQFEADIYNAIRDVGGVSTLATHPFMPNVEAVDKMFGRVRSVLSTEWCDFDGYGLKVFKGRFKKLEQKRWAHVDLAINRDSAGITCGYVSGFKEIPRGYDVVELLPVVTLDFVLEVRPPPGQDIVFSKIRTLFYKLSELGMPLTWITFDSFQSTDSLQILAQHGYITGIRSVDTSPFPYEVAKTAIVDGRVLSPEHGRAQTELIQLERNNKNGKVDHPPSGSKDCADAIASVVYGLSYMSEIWHSYDISLERLPVSLRGKKESGKRSVEGQQEIGER